MSHYQRMLEAGKDMHALKALAERHGWRHSFDFRKRLLQETILVTDTAQHIVFASQSLTQMNGYLPAEVLGWKPTMFQGPETSAGTRDAIRAAIAAYEPFTANLLNYRKDGSTYHCHIDAYPIHNQRNEPVHFIAFEQVIDGAS